jgi:ABC-2 type transport system ATP-binding protein
MEAMLNTTIATNQQLKDMISLFDFEGCLKKRFAQLSGGQKQKLTIIMILMQDKPLTFFDEVTSGLDFQTRQKLMSKVVEYYKDKESTVCVVSHYYDELEKFVNKLLILDQGKVAAFGNVDELFKRFCGEVIFIVDNNPSNCALTKDLAKLAAPAHLLAFPCNNKDEESKLAALFVANNINFKRTDKDLEFLFVNALKKEGR